MAIAQRIICEMEIQDLDDYPGDGLMGLFPGYGLAAGSSPSCRTPCNGKPYMIG